MATKKELEDHASVVGGALEDVMPSGAGFCLLVFDFGPPGNLAYVSNADWESMLKVMREFIAKAEDDEIHSVYEH